MGLFGKKDKYILYWIPDTEEIERGRITSTVYYKEGGVRGYMVENVQVTYVELDNVIQTADSFTELHGLSHVIEYFKRKVATLEDALKNLSVTNAAALAALKVMAEENKKQTCKCKGGCHGKSHS